MKPLKDRVLIDKNKEYGWKREDISEAIDAYAAKGNIITAISLNLLEDQSFLSSIIRTNSDKDEDRLMRLTCFASERDDGESDKDYSKRAKKELLEQIENSNYLDRAKEKDKENFYFILYPEIPKFPTK